MDEHIKQISSLFHHLKESGFSVKSMYLVRVIFSSQQTYACGRKNATKSCFRFITPSRLVERARFSVLTL